MHLTKRKIQITLHSLALIFGITACLQVEDPILDKLGISLLIFVSLSLIKCLQKPN
jgi:hypothetical protein